MGRISSAVFYWHGILDEQLYKQDTLPIESCLLKWIIFIQISFLALNQFPAARCQQHISNSVTCANYIMFTVWSKFCRSCLLGIYFCFLLNRRTISTGIHKSSVLYSCILFSDKFSSPNTSNYFLLHGTIWQESNQIYICNWLNCNL